MEELPLGILFQELAGDAGNLRLGPVAAVIPAHVPVFFSTWVGADIDCCALFGGDTISPTSSRRSRSFPMATKAVDADGSELYLNLSDIIHTVSPSPSPHLDMEQQRADTVSPEPLTEVEISQMQRRVAEMGLSFSAKGMATAVSREKELADMVNTLATPRCWGIC